MVIPTGINVNKNKRVEKMTEEEVKVLIKELRDEIPAIHDQLHKEEAEAMLKESKKQQKENKE